MNRQTAKIQDSLLLWSRKNLRDFPWRKKGASPYEIFVAEMLLKRTTAKAAASVYKKFLRKYPNIKKIANSNEEDVRRIIKPIGYPKRAREMKNASRFITENFNSTIPQKQSSLLEIPFIGNYVSNAILSLSFNKPYPMVDSNVNRIINRVYFGQNPPTTNINKMVMQIAHKVLPKDKHRIFNLAMLDLGGTICLPKNPKCNICPLRDTCKFKKARLMK